MRWELWITLYMFFEAPSRVTCIKRNELIVALVKSKIKYLVIQSSQRILISNNFRYSANVFTRFAAFDREYFSVFSHAKFKIFQDDHRQFQHISSIDFCTHREPGSWVPPDAIKNASEIVSILIPSYCNEIFWIWGGNFRFEGGGGFPPFPPPQLHVCPLYPPPNFFNPNPLRNFPKSIIFFPKSSSNFA